MRVGLVAAGVGALAIALAGGAVASIHLNARRAVASLDVDEARLRATPVTREPVSPVLPGTFTDCVAPHRTRMRVPNECTDASARGDPGVPASCRPLMEDGNRWVEDWLRCAQRESLGHATFAYYIRQNHFPTAEEAGLWLGLHLRALPARQCLDECRLAVSHARDDVWSGGAGGCMAASSLLKPIVKPCRDALAETSADVRTDFRAHVDRVSGQLPTNAWLGGSIELVVLRELVEVMATESRWSWTDRLWFELDLPRTKETWDANVSRQSPGQVYFDNAGGPMQFDLMIECDQLRDLLKDFATSPKPAP